MTLRCHSCGYRSSNAAFFRVEKAGAIGRRHQVCNGCRPYEPTKTERRLGRWMFSLGVTATLFAAYYGDQVDSAGLGFVFLLAYVFGRPALIGIHEAGHALAACMLGYRVLNVCLGTGPRAFAFRLGRLPLILRRYLFAGGLTRMIALRTSPRRWPLAVIYLAGALANLAFAGLTGAVLVALEGFPPTKLIGATEASATALMMTSVLMALGNLWPTKAEANEGQASDGALVLSLLAKPQVPTGAMATVVEGMRLNLVCAHDAAASFSESLLETRPTDPWLLCNLIHQVMRGHGPDAALDRYARVVVSGPSQPYYGDLKPMTAYLQASLAWAMLHSTRQTDMSLIEAYALAAQEALPEAAEIKATYGAVLVRQGCPTEGEPLLLEGLRGAEDPIDRADFCRFLAEARRAVADEEGARAYEGLREHLLVIAPA